MGTRALGGSRPIVFDADAMRNLTVNNLQGPVIGPWMDYIQAAILKAALAGRFTLTHPFMDRRSDVGSSVPEYPSPDMQKAIRKALEALGFTWTDHPDPDPGHPGSSPYSEISWK